MLKYAFLTIFAKYTSLKMYTDEHTCKKLYNIKRYFKLYGFLFAMYSLIRRMRIR